MTGYFSQLVHQTGINFGRHHAGPGRVPAAAPQPSEGHAVVPPTIVEEERLIDAPRVLFSEKNQPGMKNDSSSAALVEAGENKPAMAEENSERRSPATLAAGIEVSFAAKPLWNESIPAQGLEKTETRVIKTNAGEHTQHAVKTVAPAPGELVPGKSSEDSQPWEQSHSVYLNEVREWVAATPAIGEEAGIGAGNPMEINDGKTAPHALTETERFITSYPKPAASPSSLEPAIHDFNLAIGAISVTIEAPSPAPASTTINHSTRPKEQLRATRGSSASRLRRHYLRF